MSIVNIISLLAILLVVAIVYFALKKPKPPVQADAAKQRKILEEHIEFYQELNPGERRRFEAAVRNFLSKVKITGVNTVVEDMDSVFVAAAAIIPIFAFKD